MQVLKEFPYDRRRSFVLANPFAIVFVYPRSAQPCILKGGWQDIEKELVYLFKEPAILHCTFWYHGKHRKTIRLHRLSKDLCIWERKEWKSMFEKLKISGHKNWIITNAANGGLSGELEVIVAMKRLPRKWIKELDPFVPGYKKPEKFQGRLIELHES